MEEEAPLHFATRQTVMWSPLAPLVLVASLLACSSSLTAQGDGSARPTPTRPIPGGGLDSPRGGTPAPLIPLVVLGAGGLYLAARRRGKNRIPPATQQD